MRFGYGQGRSPCRVPGYRKSGARADHAARIHSPGIVARVVPARGLHLGAGGGLSWSPGPSAGGTRLRRERSLAAKLRLIRHGACRARPSWCPRLRQPRALHWSKRRAGRSFKLGAAKDGAPALDSAPSSTSAPHTEDSLLRSGAPPGLFPSGVLLEPPPAQRPPPRPNGRRHCARNSQRPPARSRRRPPPRLAVNKERALSRALQADGRAGRPPGRGRLFGEMIAARGAITESEAVLPFGRRRFLR